MQPSPLYLIQPQIQYIYIYICTMENQFYYHKDFPQTQHKLFTSYHNIDIQHTFPFLSNFPYFGDRQHLVFPYTSSDIDGIVVWHGSANAFLIILSLNRVYVVFFTNHRRKSRQYVSCRIVFPVVRGFPSFDC